MRGRLQTESASKPLCQPPAAAERVARIDGPPARHSAADSVRYRGNVWAANLPTVFMLDGTVIGPKTVEIGNWSGRAIFSPRAALRASCVSLESLREGIYLLQSESDDDKYESSIYIGEAEELAARLKQHIADRDFESVVCFSSRDEGLTKAHIKYLEAKLIQLARDANTSRVENGNIPKGARLSEAEASDMDYFIEQVKLILPLVGVRSLVVATPHSVVPLQPTAGQRDIRLDLKNSRQQWSSLMRAL